MRILATVIALTALCIATPIDSAMYQVVMDERVTVTAYTPVEMKCSKTGCITASGKPAKVGIAAMSRDLEKRGLRFGDRIHLVGIGEYTLQDRTHERLKNHIDLFMESYQAAKKFGKRKVRMFAFQKYRNLIDNPPPPRKVA